jgi:hypothetical protein
MDSASEVVRTAWTRFLPAVAVVMVASVVLERTIRGHGIPDVRGLYWPILFVMPLLLAVGYGLGLFLLRARVAAPASALRHLTAAVLAIVVLGVASVFAQGSRPPRVAGICLVVGFIVALATFLRRRPVPGVDSEAAVA